jgi:hypothetical protein
VLPDSQAAIAERLQQESQRTVDIFQVIPEVDWGILVYTEGAQWTIHTLLAHFVSTEESILLLMKNILAGGNGSPEEFDLDQFNAVEVQALAALSPGELIARFHAARQDTVRWVQDLQAGQLQQVGRHPFLGLAPLEDILKLLYRHNQLHQRDIRRVLSGGKGA